MAKTKALQKFSDEYLKRCAEMSPEESVKFLDDFRKLYGRKQEQAKPTRHIRRKSKC